ncbi:hypothetical protein HX089_05475 [Myroides odoratimimus]|uniref:hypothetical protein n=1 Tax=Myroides odoratimimus TaxID=76832 RepID=UPI00257613BC|nr:hypothetical protein [Myroides odoratimimus]MDM1494994.1 hypothetical protein [Myroides odoratimimus]MDM1499061.1 hypothetical protein [Myroides odoratimimus]MDM1505413.1 hypothetical protein [Myroides odoratimimus]MDM1515840.1 hypothetical protein [Myroides odoratimimus]
MSVEGQESNQGYLPDMNKEGNAGNGATSNQLTDDAVLGYFKEKGHDIGSIDELLKKPEPVIETREINPYEDILDDDDKAYLNYKKETGRTRKEYEALQTNLDEVSPLSYAREQVLKESGIKLNKEQIDEYLETKLGISDINELTTSDLIELSKYGKSIKDARIEEQSKYRQPVQSKTETSQQQNSNQDELIQLANGAFMKKSDYEIAQQNQDKHNQMVKEAVNSVTAASFKVNIDDNGEQRELSYNYDYSDNDRSSAMSIVSDLGKFVQDTYQGESGFNHKQFAEDVFWLNPKNREGVISSIVHKARAEAIEEVMKQRGNVNYRTQTNNLSNTEKPGIKIVNINDI